MGLIILVALWYFFWKKKYYIRIESVGNDTPTMEQVLKIELETTLRLAMQITQQTPFLIESGNFFNANGVVKSIRKHGGIAKVKFYWAWSKPEEGPINA